MNKNISVYIHVPFCKAKCFYCDFNSFACRDEFIPAYFNAVKKELLLYVPRLKGYTIKTVFIGGGTPSVVAASYICDIVDILNRQISMDEAVEMSIETNPGTLSADKLVAYRSVGINRLSMGLQAWQEPILKQLGRIHTAKEFEKNYLLARKAGFDNINVDLIFGIPNQTLEQWHETLECVTALQPEHLSCYSLKIEENTVFGDKLESGELEPLDDVVDREMYSLCKQYLFDNGYTHYEISNFAKKSYECRHNLVYWRAEEYIGIGAGSHSFFEGVRYNNVYDIEQYISRIDENMMVSENFEPIDKKESMSEFMILGLRLINGVSADSFKVRFGVEMYAVYGEQIDKMLKKGLLAKKLGRFVLTTTGLDYANEVFMEFI